MSNEKMVMDDDVDDALSVVNGGRRGDVSTDAGFLRQMIKHHASGVQMARDYMAESDAKTRSPEVGRLAVSIINKQTAEIEKMKGMLK